uniref:Uncharacterized protein n=1 Tax=Knipowitschia caucasica TaxID=637954 RepID=A0AAV2MGG0_KNICA
MLQRDRQVDYEEVGVEEVYQNLDKYRISFKSYTSEYQNQPSDSTSIGAIASSTVGLSENEPQPGNDKGILSLKG